jgi:hypothetical protein
VSDFAYISYRHRFLNVLLQVGAENVVPLQSIAKVQDHAGKQVVSDFG